MAGISLQLEDAAAAVRDLALLGEAVRDAARLRLMGRFTLRYARGIETGSRRRAGPARMLAGGTEATRAAIPDLILSDLKARRKVQTDAIRRVWMTEVQRRTPVRTGRLRDNFIVQTGRG